MSNIVVMSQPVALPMLFYTFDQNNSGGNFHVNDSVCHYVIVEAESAAKANAIAEQLGIYFDGVADGRDCECCGDRWSSVSSYDGDPEPLIYEQNPVVHEDLFAEPGEVYCRVFYADGRIAEYRQAEPVAVLPNT